MVEAKRKNVKGDARVSENAKKKFPFEPIDGLFFANLALLCAFAVKKN